MELFTNILFGLVIAGFFAGAMGFLHNLRAVRKLPAADSSLGHAGFCSVLIAARDEEARLESTVRRLFAQENVTMEVMVVNDRSGDRTPEILQALQKEFSGLKCLHVDVLPPGWLGKCHALHLAAREAKGEWLLFTDADCWMKEDLLFRALGTVRNEGADHLTIAPGFRCKKVSVQGWVLLFLLSLSGWMSGVNRNRPKAHVGIGAFNLVRAESYRKAGGHEALRLSVVDDIWLGKLLGRAGYRSRAYLGAGDIECDWGNSLSDCIRLLEKNYFATLNFNTALVVVGSIFMAAMLGVLAWAGLSGTVAGWCAALSPLLLCVPGAVLGRRVGFPLRAALLVPFMVPVFWYTLINSAVVTLRQGGVRWRDTFYSIEELKEWASR